MILKTRQNNY